MNQKPVFQTNDPIISTFKYKKYDIEIQFNDEFKLYKAFAYKKRFWWTKSEVIYIVCGQDNGQAKRRIMARIDGKC